MNYYFLINKQTNIVENYIAWDGQTEWTPDETHFIVPAETTPAIDWVWDETTKDWVSVEGIGNGGIGDEYKDGKLVQPMPVMIQQPISVGTQEL